jgi:homogentisate 1,2-dioxygenase
VVLDGEVSVAFVELADASAVAAGKDGTVQLAGTPNGKKMGRIHLKRGHQALLPRGAAYQFTAANPSVMIQQTIVGDLTVQKWAEICAH